MHVHVDDLPRLIFLENPSGNHISIEYSQLQTSKDLFFFLFDLFCKGVVALYSDDGGTSVDLTALSASQLKHVAERMALAGIAAVLEDDVEGRDVEGGAAPGAQTHINMPQLTAMPDDAPLDAFVLRLRMQGRAYRLSFRLERSGAGGSGPFARAGCGRAARR